MVESSVDRTTLFGDAEHPLIGAEGALASASTTTLTNVINGHEAGILRNDDLQYACIFPLTNPRPPCQGTPGCECEQVLDITTYNRPLCDGGVQRYAKAYPSVRELRVLKGVGDVNGNAIAASIAPSR